MLAGMESPQHRHHHQCDTRRATKNPTAIARHQLHKRRAELPGKNRHRQVSQILSPATDRTVLNHQMIDQRHRQTKSASHQNACGDQATAPGKALLAALPDDQLQALLSQPLEKRTVNTRVGREALLADIGSVRQKGMAIDREEHALGVSALAVVLDLPGNERYALSVAVPTLRFDDRLESLLRALLQTKAEIESLAGK